MAIYKILDTNDSNGVYLKNNVSEIYFGELPELNIESIKLKSNRELVFYYVILNIITTGGDIINISLNETNGYTNSRGGYKAQLLDNILTIEG